MKKFLFILILLAEVCYSQNNRDKRNDLVYAAEVSLYDKNYKQSLNYFTKAFKYAPPQTSNELLDAASVALKLNKIKIAEVFLKESVTKYKAPLEFINAYAKLLPYKDSQSIKKINVQYNDLLKEYYFQLKNISAYLQVEKLTAKDQYVRSLPNYYLGIDEEKASEMLFKYIDAVNKKDTLGIKEYGRYVNFKDKNFENLKFKLEENTDSLNIREYIDLTKKHGFLENGWLLLWHHRVTYGEDNFVWNFFKPYITSEIEKGNLERDFFTQFEDAITMQTNGTQKYGTIPQFDIYPLDNVQNVDLIREKVGLPPLYYDKIIYDINIPMNYKIDEKKFREAVFSKVKSL